MAPTVMVRGMPVVSIPTSVSSTLPRKMRSDMSAITATVVPSLRVLAWITELPTCTGTSSTRPSTVARTMVLLSVAL